MAIIHGVGYRTRRARISVHGYLAYLRAGQAGYRGMAGPGHPGNRSPQRKCAHHRELGPSLFRALTLPGVPVACVDNLDSYGLLPGVSEQRQRARILQWLHMYSPAIGSGPVMDYLGQTALDTLQGADVLKNAPKMYTSTVQYPETPIAQKLKGIAQVHMANFGTRIFYCDHGSFDSHSNQHGMHDKLWKDVSEGVFLLLR